MDELVGEFLTETNESLALLDQELLKLGGKISRKADIDLAEMKN